MASEEDDDLIPTPEQAEAYRQRCEAAIGLGRFDKFCAGLHSSQVRAHTNQPNCVVVPVLGTSMAAVEYDDKIGIAVPAMHASWIEGFPFDFIGVTAEEVFFVSKRFRWLNEDIEVIGISLGPMIPSEMLAKMCNQANTEFIVVEGDSLANPKEGRKLRAGVPVHVYQAQEKVPLFDTRSHFERIHRNEVFDSKADLRSHFQG